MSQRRRRRVRIWVIASATGLLITKTGLFSVDIYRFLSYDRQESS